MKRILLLISLSLLIFIVACSEQELRGNIDKVTGLSTDQPMAATAPEPVALNSNNNTLRVASFNLQIFGETKATKSDVMAIYTEIMSRYDIIAVQEIRDTQSNAINQLVASLPGYKYVIGPRLGSTSSKEQYAYIYNPERVSLIDSYTATDVGQVFERPPFVAKFEVNNFTMIFIDSHTKPDNAAQEIKNLDMAVQEAEQKFANDSNFMLMGDLNADCNYYNHLLAANDLSNMIWEIPDSADTTAKTTDCAYDRFIATADFAKYIRSSGVDRYDTLFGLTNDQAISVSDHYPIYADISIS